MPSVAEALALANQLQQSGRLAEAEEICQQVLAADPNNAAACHLLATLAFQRADFERARVFAERSAALAPHVAGVHNNLGVILQQQGQLADAMVAYRRAIELKPDLAQAFNNLSVIFREQLKIDDAMAHARRAVELQPEYVEAHNNLGVAYQQQGQLDEAVACYQRAIELKPDFADGHNNLAAALQTQGKFEDAWQHSREALRLDPNYPEAHYNHAALALLHGDFENGLPEYEWRWQCKNFDRRVLVGRQWAGRRIAGGMVLLHAEQGLGDTLQFIRYAPLVKQRVSKVGLFCLPRFVPLLSRCQGIDEFFSADEESPPAVAEVALMSLPWVFGTTLTTIPHNVPYLFADPQLVEHWGARLKEYLPGEEFKIGISWQGNPTFRGDKTRSIPLTQFAPLAKLPKVRLISLQHGAGTEQIAGVRDVFPVTELGPDVDRAGAFVDTAAIMMNLDLVITSDTAIAHLAGGLGVPVWLALRFVPEWRWLLERPDSPWYPTMRLFRQKRHGDWPGVFADMAAELRGKIAGF